METSLYDLFPETVKIIENLDVEIITIGFSYLHAGRGNIGKN